MRFLVVLALVSLIGLTLATEVEHEIDTSQWLEEGEQEAMDRMKMEDAKAEENRILADMINAEDAIKQQFEEDRSNGNDELVISAEEDGAQESLDNEPF